MSRSRISRAAFFVYCSPTARIARSAACVHRSAPVYALMTSSANAAASSDMNRNELALPMPSAPVEVVTVGTPKRCGATNSDKRPSGNSTQISMGGKGRWVDNVFVERLWRSVRYEHVYLHAYESVAEARSKPGRYLDFCNRSRPHSWRDDPDDQRVDTDSALFRHVQPRLFHSFDLPLHRPRIGCRPGGRRVRRNPPVTYLIQFSIRSNTLSPSPPAIAVTA
ncbi:MAG: transposase [Herminiimonas sp.]|nr:transposase [Herminiimonas sp.]